MDQAGIYFSRIGLTRVHGRDALSPGLLPETLPGPKETSEKEKEMEKNKEKETEGEEMRWMRRPAGF